MSPAVALPVALLAAMFVSTPLFAVTYLALGRWARIHIDKVQVGFGPTILKATSNRTPIAVALFPLSASATVRGMNPLEEDPEPPAPPLLLWHDAPLGRRLVLMLAPRFVSALVALALLGPRELGAAFGSGLVDVPAAFYGALPLLERAAERYHREGFLVLVGLALTKTLAFQIYQLPFDVMNAFSRCKGKMRNAKRAALVHVAFVGLGGAWLVAYVRFAIHA